MFANRIHAGGRLGEALAHLVSENVVVLGLPRGGVPVAFEVAKALHAPLDVIIVRKLGVPYQPELAMGAIGEGGVRVIDPRVMAMAGVDEEDLAAVERRERAELERRSELYRAGRHRVPLESRTVVIVDDGIATGSTARAACQVARADGASRVIFAAPVAPRHTVERLRDDADEVVVLDIPEPFYAIGQFYADFSQTSDAEVTELLEASPLDTVTADRSQGTPSDDPPMFDADVLVETRRLVLDGHLMLPEAALGVVVFAHGSGSSRHSPRNRFVARALNEGGIGTLLFDLLTPAEELDRSNVFDIDLLAARLIETTSWLETQAPAAGLPVGYFGASTGAAAALWAAADLGKRIRAVVSRGGRPDLAGRRLDAIASPTLLIVGGRDEAVLQINRRALQHLGRQGRLEIVPGATHLFEEPGALERVARLAREWFEQHLRVVADAGAVSSTA